MQLSSFIHDTVDLNGISPTLLIDQIHSTVGYLGEIATTTQNRKFLADLQNYDKEKVESLGMSLAQYFYLCMSAHFATAGTYVPTNVDNLIRYKLWKIPGLIEEKEKMFHITVDSFSWDYSPVTGKIVKNESQKLSTHEGTWFSVAMGAYGYALEKKNESQKKIIEEMVIAEILREQKLLQSFYENEDGINFLKTASLVAHNLGDLDRILEQWEVPKSNLLMREVFRLGHEKKEKFSTVFQFMGENNKVFMAPENHRHFALRKFKKLRTKERYLLPLCPFIYDWGKSFALDNNFSDEDRAQLLSTLFQGHKYLPQTVSYPRAARGLMDTWVDGKSKLQTLLTPTEVKEIFSGKFLEIFNIEEERFQGLWQWLPYVKKKWNP